MSKTSGRRVGIGILGAGNILGRYVKGMSRFPELAVVGCASRSPDRAREAAEDAGIAHFDSVAELLASPDVQVVLNITTPLVHAETTAAALAAGKHVYVEKPITATLAAADDVIAQAGAAGLLLGSAPDTFLGSAAQTAPRRWTTARSANRSARPPSSPATGWRPGIRTRRSCSSRVAGRSPTWGRTTSPPW